MVNTCLLMQQLHIHLMNGHWFQRPKYYCNRTVIENFNSTLKSAVKTWLVGSYITSGRMSCCVKAMFVINLSYVAADFMFCAVYTTKKNNDRQIYRLFSRLKAVPLIILQNKSECHQSKRVPEYWWQVGSDYDFMCVQVVSWIIKFVSSCAEWPSSMFCNSIWSYSLVVSSNAYLTSGFIVILIE